MSEEVKICKVCGTEKPIMEFHKDIVRNGKQIYKNKCKVCSAVSKRSLIYNEIFTKDIIHIIFDSILNEKVSTINELSLIINIDLDLLFPYIKSLKIKSKNIKIGFTCPTCGSESSKIISQFEHHKDNYCSKKCYDMSMSMEVAMHCKWCNKEFIRTPLKGQENYFCCHECSTKFQSIAQTKDLVVKICENCGSKYDVRECDAKGRRFCSNKCVGEYFTGENNHRYVERFMVKCDWCKTDVEETEYSYSQSVHHFCSNDCRSEHYSKIFSQTPEWKEFMRVQMTNRLSDGLFSHTNTKPQIAVNGLLDGLGISYENEYNCKHYAVDNYLKKYNLMIEVMGGFWHCDSRKYEQISYLSQAEAISRDKGKNLYIKRYYGIKTLYLWEYDINTNPELCKELILSYISNKGILSNYHSFNYNIFEELNINDDLIVPYMEYKIEDLNEIIDLSVREARSNYQPDKHIIFDCEQCGEETSSFANYYINNKHHFCSRKCNASYYGEKKLKINKVCETCGDNIPHKNGICKVCIFKTTHKMTYSDKWSEELSDIILNNILYKRIEYLNELEDILGIQLKEILEYIKRMGYMTKLRVRKFCTQCGEEFTLPTNRIIDGKDKFCSPECSQLFQKRDKIKVNCQCCGEEVERTQSQYDKSKNHFCSTTCSEIWMKKNRVSAKIDKVCEICGIGYQVDLCRVEKSVACSSKCQGKWQSIHLIGDNANGRKTKELIII